jgi:hypothetical protein
MSATLEPVTADNAENAVTELETSIANLLAVIEQETRLTRAGLVRDAAALDQRKGALARVYSDNTARIKANKELLARVLPAKLRALTERHRHLQASLQTNMTVLATAHAVSQDIVRSVADEMTRRAAPSTYSAGGKANTPPPRAAQPIAVSRSI